MKNELTIFYTDDDRDDLEFFTEIVETISSNIKVVQQTNGMELINQLKNPPPTPHLIFLDLNMPGLSGLETLTRLRQMEDHKNLPVVILSTSNDEKTIDTTLKMGANFYVPKSGVYESLKKSIEHALSINWKNFIPSQSNFVYNY
jgi:CheY-like chemotaxis protein